MVKRFLVVLVFVLVALSTMASTPISVRWPDGIREDGSFDYPLPANYFSGQKVMVLGFVRTDLVYEEENSYEIFRVLLGTGSGEFWVSARYFDVVEPVEMEGGIHDYRYHWSPASVELPVEGVLLIPPDEYYDVILLIPYVRTQKDLLVERKWEQYSRVALGKGWKFAYLSDFPEFPPSPYDICLAMMGGMFTQGFYDEGVPKLCWGEAVPTSSLEYLRGFGLWSRGAISYYFGSADTRVMTMLALPSVAELEGILTPCSGKLLPFYTWIGGFEVFQESFRFLGWERISTPTPVINLEVKNGQDTVTLSVIDGGYIVLSRLDQWYDDYEWGDLDGPFFSNVTPPLENMFFYKVTTCE